MERMHESQKTLRTSTRVVRGDTGDEASREDERGDVAEPDAPTSADENEAMSTILDVNPMSGVQEDADEE